MRTLLLLCVLLHTTIRAQTHPSVEPFGDALLVALQAGDAKQFERLLCTASEHALVVKAVEDAAPTGWMDSLQTKPYPSKTKLKSTYLALRMLGDKNGIVWGDMSGSFPEELTMVIREAPDGTERNLKAAEFRFPFRSGGRYYAIRVDFLLNTGKDWRIGNDGLWLEAYIEAVAGPGDWQRLME